MSSAHTAARQPCRRTIACTRMICAAVSVLCLMVAVTTCFVLLLVGPQLQLWPALLLGLMIQFGIVAALFVGRRALS